jgi:hypothetical protein
MAVLPRARSSPPENSGDFLMRPLLDGGTFDGREPLRSHRTDVLIVVLAILEVPSCVTGAGPASSSSAAPSQAVAATKGAPSASCPCTPESSIAGRKTLDCYCAGKSCPPSLDAGLVYLTALCKYRDVSVIRKDGCGLVKIGANNGFTAEGLTYDRESEKLAGAWRAGDICPSPCACSVLAGINECATVQSCVVCGTNDRGLPPCEPTPARQ